MKKKNNQGKAKTRVMVVDDHGGMRYALRRIINLEPDLEVVAEADSGQNALDLIGRAEPDVVLMDGSMPEMNGIEATRQLRQLQPGVRVIGLTLYEDPTYLEEMIAAGARGYVLKAGAPAKLIKAVRTVAAGTSYFDEDVPRRSSAVAQNQAVTEELTSDELAVVKRVADGQTNVEIAAGLELSVSAVERHRAAAMKKLNVRSRTELARVAAVRDW